MSEKIVIYLGGGSMSGVFGAGIVTGLQEANTYDKIEAIFSASCGVFNMAYFLSRQSRFGSSIYYEDLINDFIFPVHIITGTLQRFWHRFFKKIPSENMHDVVDISYLMKVVQSNKALNVKAVQDNPIKSFVKIYDPRKQKVEYINLKDNVLTRMKECVSVIPYYFPKNQEYVDGDVISPIGFDYIRNKYKHEKIAMCLNHPPNDPLTRSIRNTLEGMVATMMFKKAPMVRIFAKKRRIINEEIKKIYKDNNAILICPPGENQTTNHTTDHIKLEDTFQMGIKKANEILEFMRY